MSPHGLPERSVRNAPRPVTAAVFADTVRTAPQRCTSREEERWIARIERRRAELGESTDRLAWTDYGAGEPQSGRTEEQMVAGVLVGDTLGSFSSRASMPPSRCLSLFHLVRSVRPARCVELGTAVGISAAYHAAALKLNGHGSLVTLEGAGPLAGVAERTLRGLRLGNAEVVVGRFADTLPGVLDREAPVDYVLVDGHHDERATLAYWRLLLPSLADPALVVLDDIAWSPGMERAWETIARDERVYEAVALGAMGACVVAAPLRGRAG